MIFTHLLVDQSGSMSNVKAEVVRAIDKFVDGLAREPVDQQVSLSFFEGALQLVRPFGPIGYFQPLAGDDYEPNGDTALYDAIIDGTGATEQATGPERRAIVAIVTDGRDTCSRRTAKDARAVMDAHRKKGWAYIFLSLSDDGSSALADTLKRELGVIDDDIHSASKGQLPAAMRQLTTKIRGLLNAPA